MTKQLLLLLLTVLLSAAGYFAYIRTAGQGEGMAGAAVQREAPAVPVVLGTAELRTLARRLEAVGTTVALRAIEVVPLTSGRIVEIAFEPGAWVEAGAVLARLDDDIERADLAEAEAQLRQSRQALERADALLKRNAISQAAYDQLLSERATAQASVERARRRLADRSIRAPFAGVVGLRRVELGARVDDGTVITTLDDIAEIEVEFALPELFYAQVAPGQTVEAESAAFPGKQIRGTVARIDSRVDATARAFKVRARFPNPDRALPAGMFMHLSVLLAARTAVMIPEEAVIAEGASTYVVVAVEGRAVRRAVQLGQRERGSVEVSEGIAGGDLLILRGGERLRDGAAIRPLGEEGPPPAASGTQGDGA